MKRVPTQIMYILRNGETKNNLDFSAYISVLKSLVDLKSLELWAE